MKLKCLPLLVLVGIMTSALLGCTSTGPTGYTPPSLTSGHDSLSISDKPMKSDSVTAGRFPAEGRLLGYVFEGKVGQVYDIVLERTSGNDVPAEVLYNFNNGSWSDPIAWATADATQISISGWAVPEDGTYLVLVDVVSGDRDGTFELTITCASGCGSFVSCGQDTDCPEGMICWDGICVESNIECQTNEDCHANEICERGFCVQVCIPSPEICDGIDNNCDGVVDEGCAELPCTSNADCAEDQVCQDGRCVAICQCQGDSDCPPQTICYNCWCISEECPDADGDGWTFCQGDCNDQDPTINPSATEICGDGVDNDCDGIVDNGCGGQPCRTDDECNLGQICWQGFCTSVPCGSDSDCMAGEVCVAGVCQLGCGGGCYGGACCNDVCVDLLFDAQNCGACGLVCGAEEACLRGVCVPPEGCRTDEQCDDGDPSTTDVCVNGMCLHCGEEICGDGIDNDCNGLIDEGCENPCQDGCYGGTCCDGVCVDILFDAQNCGACGLVCGAEEACVRGVCVGPEGCRTDEQCDDGDPYTLDLCVNGTCIHTTCTQEVCGDAIDNDCDGLVDEDCQNTCGDAVCANGQACCDSVCVDILFDAQNCGACGLVCGAEQACVRGVCVGPEGCRTDEQCDDGDPNTVDVCVAGTCVHR